MLNIGINRRSILRNTAFSSTLKLNEPLIAISWSLIFSSCELWGFSNSHTEAFSSEASTAVDIAMGWGCQWGRYDGEGEKKGRDKQKRTKQGKAGGKSNRRLLKGFSWFPSTVYLPSIPPYFPPDFNPPLHPHGYGNQMVRSTHFLAWGGHIPHLLSLRFSIYSGQTCQWWSRNFVFGGVLQEWYPSVLTIV